MKVSVISATWNRAELLDNALYTYSKQDMDPADWEYLICDDMSTDDTKAVVDKWIKKGLPLRYFTAEELGHPKEPGKWRDGCKLRNSLSTHARGEVLIATHPEIMIPTFALTAMYEAVQEDPQMWVTAIPYWLPEVRVKDLKGWKKNLDSLQKVDGFYDPNWPDNKHSPGAIDYTNNNQEVRPTWDSEVFWAMDMHLWRWMGGFPNFEAWGSVDVNFMNRRNIIGIKTKLAKHPLGQHHDGVVMVYHQNHSSERDEKKWMDELSRTRSTYKNAQEAREAGALYSQYAHGHRERAIGGDLSTVMGDHKSRYKFAAGYARGKVVLDCPCGTGYGAEFLAPTCFFYSGVDADAESIKHAWKYHAKTQNIYFSQGTMEKLNTEDESINMIVCFEGFEHLTKDQKYQWIDEMYRVLAPGGTFIISTPQKGATGGTPWDIDMVDREDLEAYFGDGRWKNLDWFYQTHYGAEQEPRPGIPPRNAEIMILGGSVVK